MEKKVDGNTKQTVSVKKILKNKKTKKSLRRDMMNRYIYCMERIRIKWDEKLRLLVDWLFVFFVYSVHVRIYVLFFFFFWFTACIINVLEIGSVSYITFTIKERDDPNYFNKKNTERIRICVLFVISYLFRQCHCHKQQIFFLLCTFFFVFVHNTS